MKHRIPQFYVNAMTRPCPKLIADIEPTKTVAYAITFDM